MKKKENSLTALFLTFLQIGAFTFGGGYAMLSLIQKIVVEKRKLISEKEFADMIAIVQSLPGIIAVNTALYVGNKVNKKRGSLCAALGAILPSFLIILLIALFFSDFKDYPVVERIFKGIRPCVVALILVPAVKMAKSTNLSLKNTILPMAAIALIWGLKLSPIYVILATVMGAILYSWIYKKKQAV
ncbi:MAG: chromate transporter [Bacteroidales bacterium]